MTSVSRYLKDDEVSRTLRSSVNFSTPTRSIRKVMTFYFLIFLKPFCSLSESEVEKLQRQFTANKIDDRIWLGDISSAQDIQALDLLKITHVLSVMNFQPIGFVDDRRSRKHIHAYDSPSANLIDHFDEAFAFIDKALAEGSNVLIHCLAGSTSPKRSCFLSNRIFFHSFTSFQVFLGVQRLPVLI